MHAASVRTIEQSLGLQEKVHLPRELWAATVSVNLAHSRTRVGNNSLRLFQFRHSPQTLIPYKSMGVHPRLPPNATEMHGHAPELPPSICYTTEIWSIDEVKTHTGDSPRSDPEYPKTSTPV